MNNYCIVTTINPPTKAIEELHKRFGRNLVIVGDDKTPKDWKYNDATFLPISIQKTLALDKHIPLNHYARKNMGYLWAFTQNAELIYDTDDDNIPNENWKIRSPHVEAHESLTSKWFNAYGVFGDEYIWPRGFSLKHLRNVASAGLKKFRVSYIQQGLADGEPDVDAVWRLAFGKKHFFSKKKSVYVQPNSWCPFNSQSTWWFPPAYALMYLPMNASFRMTDIWRSFIAQRCLWELGEGVTFHSPSEVFQDRNEHDLLKDFEDEVSGYLNNDKIVEILSDLELKQGQEYVCENLLACYVALVENGILPQAEIDSVKTWIKCYENVTRIV